MIDLDPKSLYQQLILQHANSPRHEGSLPSATHEATLTNPLCGDRVTLRLAIEGDAIHAAKFEARGCMIAKASASLLADTLHGLTLEEAQAYARMLDALLGPNPPNDAGALEPLRGAREFPARQACVLLAWRALEKAVDSPQKVTPP